MSWSLMGVKGKEMEKERKKAEKEILCNIEFKHHSFFLLTMMTKWPQCEALCRINN